MNVKHDGVEKKLGRILVEGVTTKVMLRDIVTNDKEMMDTPQRRFRD